MHTCAWTPSLTMRAPSQGASRSRVLTGPQRCAPRRSAVRVCASSEPPKARFAHSLACLSWWCCHSDCRSVSPGLTVFACVVSVPHRSHLVATAQGHAEQPGRGAGSARAGTTQPGCSLRGRRGAPLLVGVACGLPPSHTPSPAFPPPTCALQTTQAQAAPEAPAAPARKPGSLSKEQVRLCADEGAGRLCCVCAVCDTRQRVRPAESEAAPGVPGLWRRGECVRRVCCPPCLCSRRTVVFGTPADTAMPSNYFLNIVLGITALVLLCYFGGILPK